MILFLRHCKKHTQRGGGEQTDAFYSYSYNLVAIADTSQSCISDHHKISESCLNSVIANKKNISHMGDTLWKPVKSS